MTKIAAWAWVGFLATTVSVTVNPPTRIDRHLQIWVADGVAQVLEAAPWVWGVSTVLAYLGAAPLVVTVIAAASAIAR
jgi:hypothetical protein